MTATATKVAKVEPKTGDRRVRIVHDDHPENPRTAYHNVGEIISFHRDFAGDRSRYVSDWSAAEFFAEVEPPAEGDLVLGIDVQDYGSGGVRLRLEDGVTDRSDAALVIDAETIRKEWDGDTVKARQCAEAEIATYEQWINGDVYGFVVERCDVCSLGHAHWSHEDSCWGFYGLDLDDNGMLENIPDALHAAARKAAESPEYGC